MKHGAFAKFSENTAAFIAKLETSQSMSTRIRPVEQTMTSISSAAQVVSNSIVEAVTTVAHPMCDFFENDICSVANNSTAITSSASLFSAEAVSSSAPQVISSFAQPMCDLVENSFCQAPSNSTMMTAVYSTAVSMVPSFPVLACAGTACDTVGQCAVNSSSIFAPALAISAAALTGMAAAAFTFRPSNRPRRAPYPVTPSPIANAMGMQQDDFNDGNFDGGLDEYNQEPAERAARQLFPYNSPIIPPAPAASPASAVNNNPGRRSRTDEEVENQGQEEVAQPAARRRRTAAGAVPAQRPVQSVVAGRRRLTEVERLSIGNDDNNDARGSGFDLSTPNHPEGGVRRTYRPKRGRRVAKE